MQQEGLKCIKSVGEELQCRLCKGCSIKYGKTSAGKQRFRCTDCGKVFLREYNNQACLVSNKSIIALHKESCGIRSIARILGISAGTVIKRMLLMRKQIQKPAIFLNREYEIDEMRTYYVNKSRLLWIVYALDRSTKAVVDFAVGKRNLKTLQRVTDTVLLAEANKIYTDKLYLYRSLLPAPIHSTKQYSINHIERKNLSLRTHLKRLNRKTICFSKSIAMLEASLKIYFWG